MGTVAVFAVAVSGFSFGLAVAGGLSRYWGECPVASIWLFVLGGTVSLVGPLLAVALS